MYPPSLWKIDPANGRYTSVHFAVEFFENQNNCRTLGKAKMDIVNGNAGGVRDGCRDSLCQVLQCGHHPDRGAHYTITKTWLHCNPKCKKKKKLWSLWYIENWMWSYFGLRTFCRGKMESSTLAMGHIINKNVKVKHARWNKSGIKAIEKVATTNFAPDKMRGDTRKKQRLPPCTSWTRHSTNNKSIRFEQKWRCHRCSQRRFWWTF